VIEKESQHGGSMSDALIASIAAILVALLGAGLSFVQTRRLQRRQARLVRLNAQLEELYGPIYATLEASRIAYRRLLDKLRPGSVSVAIQQASACYACSLRGLAWLAATRRCGWLTGGPGW
jgi:positive regulator of sigma E activity